MIYNCFLSNYLFYLYILKQSFITKFVSRASTPNQKGNYSAAH
jgi:hypothetical protein